MSGKKNKNKNKPNNNERAKNIDALKAAVNRGDEAVTPIFSDASVEYAEEKISKLENNDKKNDTANAQPPVKPSADNTDGSEEAEAVKEFVPKSGKHKQSTALSANISEVLGDNEELEEANSGAFEAIEAIESDGEEKVVQRPNKLYLIFAIFVIIMSIIGIISTVRFGINTVSDIANQTELKNELAVFLYPVVSVDPPDCASVEELPATIILESAIWRIILRGENANYERLFNTYMYVPAVDVEFSARAIYGNSARIEHQTVGSIDTTFTYVKDSNSYIVPVNPFYTAYTPYIREISSVGELYTVVVDYITPSALDIEGIEYENPPAKTMRYTLSKRANGMTLHSITNITEKENMYE